jgi:ESS family glutamate:Na+ symporter
MSFAGVHGTIAGMGGLLDEAGVGELVDIGLGLATISMLTGVIGGTVLVNRAVRKPHIEVAREHTTLRSTASRLSDVPPNEGDTTDDVGLDSISRSFGAIAVAIFLGLLILTGLRAIAEAFGSDLFERFRCSRSPSLVGLLSSWCCRGRTTNTSSSVAPSTTSQAFPSTSSSPQRSARCRSPPWARTSPASSSSPRSRSRGA